MQKGYPFSKETTVYLNGNVLAHDCMPDPSGQETKQVIPQVESICHNLAHALPHLLSRSFSSSLAMYAHTCTKPLDQLSFLSGVVSKDDKLQNIVSDYASETLGTC